MGGVFAPLLAWFFRLVGNEVRAKRQRKIARERKRKKAEAAAKKKAAKQAIEEKRRKATWEQLLATHKERAAIRDAELAKTFNGGPVLPLDDNPYGVEIKDAERAKNFDGGPVQPLDENPYDEE